MATPISRVCRPRTLHGFFCSTAGRRAPPSLGKLGVNHPIDTTIYNTLYVKMKIANEVRNAFTVAQVVWSRDTIYGPPVSGPNGGQILAHNAQGNQVGVFMTSSTAEPFMSLEGGNWVIYRIPLTIAQMQAINSDIHHWQNVNGGSNSNWGDPGVTADSLRISPFVFGSRSARSRLIGRVSSVRARATPRPLVGQAEARGTLSSRPTPTAQTSASSRTASRAAISSRRRSCPRARITSACACRSHGAPGIRHRRAVRCSRARPARSRCRAIQVFR